MKKYAAVAKPYAVNVSSVVQYEGRNPKRWIAPLINTDVCGARRLAASLYRLPPGETSMKDLHKEEEMYYVLRGSAHLVIGDTSFRVEPGMVVFLPPNCWHQSTNSGSEDLEYLCVFGPPLTGVPTYLKEKWAPVGPGKDSGRGSFVAEIRRRARPRSRRTVNTRLTGGDA